MKQISYHVWRWALIIICLAISIVTFIYMNQYYDPLARYPYVSDYNRDIILEHLDSDEIDYIITQQLKPGQFIPFINTEGFEIKNAALYTIAYETQSADRQEIVSFINRYRSYFTADSLKNLLSHYSYEDLINFIETQQVLREGIVLSQTPDDPYLVLHEDISVYKYVPKDLISFEDIKIQNDAAKSLQALLSDLQAVLDSEEAIQPVVGYLSYDEIMTQASELETYLGPLRSRIFLSGGENEYQLGYTVSIDGAKEYFQMILDTPSVLNTYDYDALLENADEKFLQEIEWLENNAWRYGFIIRYPRGQESVTGQLWQPFTLRYVGEENARNLYNSQGVMETFDFSE